MSLFVPTTPLGALVVAHRTDLLQAAERHHLGDVRLFGSLARGEDRAASDVDLLVTARDGARPLDLLSLACDAEEMLGVHVDVATLETLRPEFRAGVAADALTL